MKRIPEDMLPGTKHQTKFNGVLEIVEYNNHRNVLVRFTFTGYMCVSSTETIRAGSIKDRLLPSVCGVGYIGAGKYTLGNSPKKYNTWAHMLMRCYSKTVHAGNKTYIGCTVVAEWHNFQAFAEWYETNHPADGGEYVIDKDIKISGNRIYRPEACMFVTPAENTIAAHAKFYVFLSPNNERVEIYNLNEFCRTNGLTQASMSAVSRGVQGHHKGWRLAP